MSGLLEAWDWFDNGLQNVLREGGFRVLNKTQSMMVLYVAAGVQRPIEIARRMRLSRQAIRHIEMQLIKLDMISARADPSDKRSKILALTTRSKGVRQYAQQAILRLESELRARIGARNVANMRAVLSLDWGDAVNGAPATRRRVSSAKRGGRR
jgi:DNA-binding MarR family transcriptional regulator